MPSDFPWVLALVVTAVVAWTVPKALNQTRRLLSWLAHLFGRVAADAIVAALKEHLAPSWAADFDAALEEALAPILAELTDNGGTSMKDKLNATALHVLEIRRDIEPLLIEYKRRADSPSAPA